MHKLRDTLWPALSAGITFLKSVAAPDGLPPATRPEIAFAGRSNAGKSSVINALVGRKGIALVSKRPGRTQHLNFFALGETEFLVDLPGYGYAATPAQARVHWDTLIGGYLQSRKSLCGVVLVMDSRHPFGKLDRAFLAWLAPTATRVHVLLTKADKLTKQQAAETLREAKHTVQCEFPACTVQLFSSTRRTGIDEARATISAWLYAVSDVHKKPPVKGE